MLGTPNAAIQADQERHSASTKRPLVTKHSPPTNFQTKSWVPSVSAPLSTLSIRKGLTVLTGSAAVSDESRGPLSKNCNNSGVNSKKGHATHFLHKQTILKDETLLQEPHRHISGLEHVLEVTHTNASSFVNGKVGLILSQKHSKKGKMKACPFCRRYMLNRTSALLIGEDANVSKIKDEAVLDIVPSKSDESIQDHVLPQSHNSNNDDNTTTSHDEPVNYDEDIIDGPLKYTKILVEGWLLKKGSGNDWLGVTKYKPRWARLVIAHIPKTGLEIPILQVFWFETSLNPSSEIMLRNCYAETINEDPAEWKNTRCFKIVFHPNDRSRKENAVSRIFAASTDERNEWVYAINLAIESCSHGDSEEKLISYKTKQKDTTSKKELKHESNLTRWKEGTFSG